MDFRRIQLLLIGFFILFDIYLALLLINRVDIQSASIVDNPNLTITQQLQERGISIAPHIEEEIKELPLMKAAYTTTLKDQMNELKDQEVSYDESTKVLSGQFNQPVKLSNAVSNETAVLSKDQEKVIGEVLANEDWFIQGDEYQHFIYLPQSRLVIVRKAVDDEYPIVGNTAEIHLLLNENYDIESYTQSYLDGFHTLDETYPVITAREALTIQDKRIDTMLPNDSTIERMVLGYALFYSLDQYQIYSPVWHISYSRRDGVEGVVTIDARRGEVIYPATTIKQE